MNLDNIIFRQYNDQLKQKVGGYDEGFGDGFAAGVKVAQDQLTKERVIEILLSAARAGYGMDNRKQAEELAEFLISRLIIHIEE